MFIKLKLTHSDKPVKALIDSGSNISLINKDIAVKNKLKIENINNIIIKLANNLPMTVNKKVILETENRINIQLYCIDSLKQEAIFGNDILMQLKIKIDYDQQTITLNDKVYKFSDCAKNKKPLISLNNMIGEENIGNLQIINDLLKKYQENIDSDKPIKGIKYRIPLRTNEIPNEKPFPEPAYKQKILRDELNELVKKGIIRKSFSQYSSPCFTKRKPDNTYRLLIDYRMLNKISVPIQYHFPGLNEQFHRLFGMKFFSKIDLRKGFYQIELEESDKHKTAFSTVFGKFEFNRLPFGMINAPKFFHNVIVNILSDVEGVIVFVDDILLFSKTQEEHIRLLKEILERLKCNNIVINTKKSLFNKTEIPYLGYIINSDGYMPDQNKIKNFRKWQIPQTRKQLQRLLGSINWYRPFLRNVSLKLGPLYDLLKGNKRKIEIDKNLMEPIYELYDELKKGILLYFPNLNEKFIINSDASNNGFGAISIKRKVLYQC